MLGILMEGSKGEMGKIESSKLNNVIMANLRKNKGIGNRGKGWVATLVEQCCDF